MSSEADGTDRPHDIDTIRLLLRQLEEAAARDSEATLAPQSEGAEPSAAGPASGATSAEQPAGEIAGALLSSDASLAPPTTAGPLGQSGAEGRASAPPSCEETRAPPATAEVPDQGDAGELIAVPPSSGETPDRSGVVELPDRGSAERAPTPEPVAVLSAMGPARGPSSPLTVPTAFGPPAPAGIALPADLRVEPRQSAMIPFEPARQRSSAGIGVAIASFALGVAAAGALVVAWPSLRVFLLGPAKVAEAPARSTGPSRPEPPSRPVAAVVDAPAEAAPSAPLRSQPEQHAERRAPAPQEPPARAEPAPPAVAVESPRPVEVIRPRETAPAATVAQAARDSSIAEPPKPPVPVEVAEPPRREIDAARQTRAAASPPAPAASPVRGPAEPVAPQPETAPAVRTIPDEAAPRTSLAQASAPAPAAPPPANALSTPAVLDVPARIELRAGERRTLPVRIAPRPQEESRLLLVLRRVPDWLTLSSGGTVSDGIWLLPAHQATDLAVEVGDGAKGSVDIAVQLTRLDGQVLGETTLSVRVLASAVSGPARLAAPAALDEQVMARLQARSELLLDTGEVEAARTLLRTAAEAGSVSAALRLAETYDPREVTRIGVTERAADPALAVRWYRHAEALGSPVATDRLATLEPR